MNGVDIRSVMVSFLAIIISLTVHEFAHAFMADRLGDPTPGEAGRLTLNPMVIIQAHPFGALLIPLMGAFSGFLIGWAATPVNPSRVRREYSIRRASFLITVAGPVSNLILALISAFLLVGIQHLPLDRGLIEPLFQLAQMMVFANIFLALFNLLPIPPLDGFTVLGTLLPPSMEGLLRNLQQYSMVLILLIFMFGGKLIGPAVVGVSRGLIVMVQGIFV